MLDLYRDSWARAAETFAVTDLDAVGRVPWWGEEDVTLHQILVHMTAETQRHAGHADIVRELIDGQIGRRESDGNIEDSTTGPGTSPRWTVSRVRPLPTLNRLETAAHRQETRTCSSI